MSVLFRPFRTEFTILPVPVPRERRSDAEAFPDQPGAPGAFGGEFRIFRLRNQPEQRVGGAPVDPFDKQGLAVDDEGPVVPA